MYHRKEKLQTPFMYLWKLRYNKDVSAVTLNSCNFSVEDFLKTVIIGLIVFNNKYQYLFRSYG